MARKPRPPGGDGEPPVKAKAQRAHRPIDIHIGTRMRQRRVALDLSQTDVGNALGSAYQQIGKFESGENRIDAGRLFKLSDFFEVSIGYFYQGFGQSPSRHGRGLAERPGAAYVVNDVESERRRLLEALGRIRDRQVREQLIRLFETIAEGRR